MQVPSQCAKTASKSHTSIRETGFFEEESKQSEKWYKTEKAPQEMRVKRKPRNKQVHLGVFLPHPLFLLFPLLVLWRSR